MCDRSNEKPLEHKARNGTMFKAGRGDFVGSVVALVPPHLTEAQMVEDAAEFGALSGFTEPTQFTVLRATVADLLSMEAQQFFCLYESFLGKTAVYALSRRQEEFSTRQLGQKKDPYLLRDFLQDFPSTETLMKIFGVGAVIACRFKRLCDSLGLAFDQ